MSVCPNCNSQLEEDVVFCPFCGKQIADTNPAKHESTEEYTLSEEHSNSNNITHIPNDTQENRKNDMVMDSDLIETDNEDSKPLRSDTQKTTERLFCANCGAEIDADSAFCTSCGHPIGDNIPSINEVKKKKPKQHKKHILFPVIGLAAIIVIVFVIMLLKNIKGSSSNYSLYIKEEEIYYSALNKKKPEQITNDLFDRTSAVNNSDLLEYGSAISSQIFLSSDGNALFYPDLFF